MDWLFFCLMNDNRPIGIFDSGVGGLTVANAIRQMMPNENMVYFGDTAHLPYGDKSPETIRYYAAGITKFLLSLECKVIVIACNTASANAFQTVVELAGGKVPVLNVVDPVVDFVIHSGNYKHIGVIGTKSTINSDTYALKIHREKPGIMVSSLATPLFVPMIEEGFIFDDISNAIIRTYLSRHELSDIDGLILGCTHYPIIKNQINKFFNFNVDIIDSAKVVAMALQKMLIQENLLNRAGVPGHKFFVSDITPSFRVISKMFFEQDVCLELKNIWEQNG
ncbi:MAG: glutamate racemase [Bacteroidales bacterium]|nr:glutamate racemase [Bacteroidales bacterium]